MSLRISSLLALVPAVAACTAEPAPPEPPHEVAEKDDVVACAVGGRSGFEEVCAVETEVDNGTVFLTIRHPDGGFRRFEAASGIGSLEPADGADAVALAVAGETAEIAVDGDRYRIPSRMVEAGDGGG